MSERNWQSLYQSGNTLSAKTIQYLEGVDADLKALDARVSKLESPPTQTGTPSTATVSKIEPTSVVSGGMVSVIVTGTGFTTDTQVEVVDIGVGPNATSYISATQVQTQYLFPQSPGVYQVGVRNPGENLSNTKPFTVT